MRIKKASTYIVVILISIIDVSAQTSPSNTQFHDSLTQNLYHNLKELCKSDDFMFGISMSTTMKRLDVAPFYNTDPEQSDCKDITGSHPAFIESDFFWYEHTPAFYSVDTAALKHARSEGAVIGYTWHLNGKYNSHFHAVNNLTRYDYNGNEVLVYNIVNDIDDARSWFYSKLDKIIPVMRDDLGFPIVFRIFPEMTGWWFWWGSDYCTPQEFIDLWRLAVDYIRKQGCKNILFSWAPNFEVDFSYYPGDEYVDIIGFDMYNAGTDGSSGWNTEQKVYDALHAVTDFSLAHDKVSIWAETGPRDYPDNHPNYWTKHVLKYIKDDGISTRIAWVMTWYNSSWSCYTPYLGINNQTAIDDFISFRQDKNTIFLNEIPDMYQSSGVASSDLSKEVTKFKVYTSPANQTVYIKLAQKADIYLFDSKNNLIFTRSGAIQEQQIDISHLPKGVYFIRISNKKYSIIEKVLKY